MERRIFGIGLVVLAAAGAVFWLSMRAWGNAADHATTAEVGAAFLGLLLIVGFALGFDMRDWFDR